MIFSRLELVRFRNYAHEIVELGAGLNVATGLNGQGKTNLLEALYLLSRGESFRPGKSNVFLNKTTGAPAAKISAVLRSDTSWDEVSLKIAGDKRELSKNGKKVGKRHLSDTVSTILFSPESLSAVKDGPEERRRLLDDLLWVTGYEALDALKSFQKILASRNRLLRDFKRKAIQPKTFERTLASLDEIFFPVATRLTWERLLALRRVETRFIQGYRVVSPQDLVDISVDYLISGESAKEWSYEQIHDALRSRAEEVHLGELESGTTLIGPHKHDIRFLFGFEEARYYCSQGQQRALILAFKIAQIMYHYEVHQKQPVLLLDDVLSELDLDKQEKLMFFLKDLKTQILLTTTDLSKIKNLFVSQITHLSISGGKIQKG